MGRGSSYQAQSPSHHPGSQPGGKWQGWTTRSLCWEPSLSDFHTTDSYLNKAAGLLFKNLVPGWKQSDSIPRCLKKYAGSKDRVFSERSKFRCPSKRHSWVFRICLQDETLGSDTPSRSILYTTPSLWHSTCTE